MEVKRTGKRFFQLLWLYAKMDLSWLLRDTFFALLAMAADVVGAVSAISGIFLLSWRFGGIGGLNQNQVLFMLGYATVVSGLFQLFFTGNNTGHFSRRIGRGQVEHMWIQPLSLPMQLLTEGFLPFTASSNLFSGGLIFLIAINQLSLTITFLWVLRLLVSLLISLMTIVAISYLTSALAFYSPVQAEEISTYVLDSLRHLRNFPLNEMPKAIQFTLLSFIPAGLIAWFPAMDLLGQTTLGFTAGFPAICCVIFSLLAVYFTRKGLNYYVQRGSNRYLPHGHRR